MRKFGIIGYPLSHSFSPAYFKKKFEDSNLLDHYYDPYEIENIEKLLQIIESNPELEGLNVTIPYKKQVIQFLAGSTDAVKKMNACNCIRIRDGKLTGFNTDVVGFERSLQPKLLPSHNKALILGTGGAAAAVEFVLQNLGISFLYVSRDKKDIDNCISYEDLNDQLIKEYSLIINTTPLGMYPSVDSCPDIPYEYLTKQHYLFDLIYNPEQTLFLQKGAERGAVTKNGSDMLIIQAEESWKIWNYKM